MSPWHQDPSGGGASTFADGLVAAEELRQDSPEAFHTLATTKVVFEDMDPSDPPAYHLEAVHPVLQLTSGRCTAVSIRWALMCCAVLVVGC